MLRKGIAFLLLTIFIVSVSMPTIIAMMDDNADVSFLLDTKEEESKEKESSKDSEIKIAHIYVADVSLCGLKLSDLTSFYLKNYAKPYLNLLSPPPEQNIA